MLVGICSRKRPSVGGGGGGGNAALGEFDFINGSYSWGGITLTAADVVDQTGFITANGLEIPSGGTSAEMLYSAAQTFLADCQWTMVIEANILDTGFSPTTYLFTETNAGDAFFIQVSFAAEWELESGDGNTFPATMDTVNSISTGIHKLAVTQTNDAGLLSIDGNAVQSDMTGVVLPVGGFPMTKFYFGGYSSGTGKPVYIRKVSIYDAITDNPTLVSLSA